MATAQPAVFQGNPAIILTSALMIPCTRPIRGAHPEGVWSTSARKGRPPAGTALRGFPAMTNCGLAGNIGRSDIGGHQTLAALELFRGILALNAVWVWVVWGRR